MTKLITIIALATAVITAPAFAKGGNATNPNRQAEANYHQQDNSFVPSSNAYGPNY